MARSPSFSLNARAGLAFAGALCLSWLAIRLGAGTPSRPGDGSVAWDGAVSKVVLAERGDSHKVALASTEQEITINLDWNRVSRGSGGGKAVDLDLGCFYELTDGSRRAIDGLQFSRGQGGPRNVVSRQGCYTQVPWIWHTGDDRTGDQLAGGESFLVNPAGLEQLSRVAIYASIYDGVERWAETDAVVSVLVPGGSTIEVRLGEQTGAGSVCVIANIEFSGGGALGKWGLGSLSVTKEVVFYPGLEEASDAHGYHMRWSAGSK